MINSILKKCNGCMFHERDAYDHYCTKFDSVVSGDRTRIDCADARSDKGIPNGVALPNLSVDSAQWGKPCGLGACHFIKKPSQEASK